jgi:hypothetical protein
VSFFIAFRHRPERGANHFCPDLENKNPAHDIIAFAGNAIIDAPNLAFDKIF